MTNTLFLGYDEKDIVEFAFVLQAGVRKVLEEIKILDIGNGDMFDPIERLWKFECKHCGRYGIERCYCCVRLPDWIPTSCSNWITNGMSTLWRIHKVFLLEMVHQT